MRPSSLQCPEAKVLSYGPGANFGCGMLGEALGCVGTGTITVVVGVSVGVNVAGVLTAGLGNRAEHVGLFEPHASFGGATRWSMPQKT
jgi:hypothetical protein